MELNRLQGIAGEKKLADQLGISRQAIGQVLAGTTRALTAENSARAARFLKVDHFWLATGEGEPRPPDPSEAALTFARRWDALKPAERAKFDALLVLSMDGVPDETIEKQMPVTTELKRKTAKH